MTEKSDYSEVFAMLGMQSVGGPDEDESLSASPDGHVSDGRARKPVWMYLKRTNQLGVFQDTTKDGVRVKHIGVVPFDEIRVATDQEIDDWLSR